MRSCVQGVSGLTLTPHFLSLGLTSVAGAKHLVEVKYIQSTDQLADALTKVPTSEKIIDALLGPQDQQTDYNLGVCCKEIVVSQLNNREHKVLAKNGQQMSHFCTFYARRSHI